MEFFDYGPGKGTLDVIEALPIPFDANIHSVGDHNHYCAYFACTVDNANCVKSVESDDIRWFSGAEIARLDNVPDNVRRLALFALEKHKT
jgi:hypothetical protein